MKARRIDEGFYQQQGMTKVGLPITGQSLQAECQGAIEKGLLIGSGEIESAHRYAIQKRLKLPGAWWKAANVEPMLALRVVRANDDWEKYWQNLPPAVAS